MTVEYEEKGIKETEKLKEYLIGVVENLKEKEKTLQHDYNRESISDMIRSIQDWGIDGLDSNIRMMKEVLEEKKREAIENKAIGVVKEIDSCNKCIIHVSNNSVLISINSKFANKDLGLEKLMMYHFRGHKNV